MHITIQGIVYICACRYDNYLVIIITYQYLGKTECSAYLSLRRICTVG